MGLEGRGWSSKNNSHPLASKFQNHACVAIAVLLANLNFFYQHHWFPIAVGLNILNIVGKKTSQGLQFVL